MFVGVLLKLGLDVATDTVILIVAEIDLVVSTVSVAVMVTVDVPATEGDPDNVPDVALIVRPVGKLVAE